MKNIHVLPTDKPSRLWKNNLLQGKLELSEELLPYNTSQNIYITSDSEIKEGDWFYCFQTNNTLRCFKKENLLLNGFHIKYQKIILTTDGDLIKNGVQPIDDDFLEWFVKNPSCEEVEIELFPKFSNKLYGLIIPKEEPKQETLEEAAESYWVKQPYNEDAFIEGAKWQAERMYSEADKIMKFLDTEVELKLSDKKTIERIKWYFETYFEQFKKK